LITLLYGQDATIEEFVRSVYGRADIVFPGGRGIGVQEQGKLIAGIVFHDWNPDAGTIEMSVAAVSSRWLQRKVMAAVARYVFDGAKVQLVIMRTSEANTKACRAAAALGFAAYRIPRLRGIDEAEIIYTMPAEKWRAGRFGARQEAAS
jgi:RimJ/RimL family protein N-acetyltransferase